MKLSVLARYEIFHPDLVQSLALADFLTISKPIIDQDPNVWIVKFFKTINPLFWPIWFKHIFVEKRLYRNTFSEPGIFGYLRPSNWISYLNNKWFDFDFHSSQSLTELALFWDLSLDSFPSKDEISFAFKTRQLYDIIAQSLLAYLTLDERSFLGYHNFKPIFGYTDFIMDDPSSVFWDVRTDCPSRNKMNDLRQYSFYVKTLNFLTYSFSSYNE